MADKKRRAAVPTGGKKTYRAKHFDAPARRIFLVHLAETANVTASATKAGVSTSKAYALRRKNDDFRGDWVEALAEGFARLETELLAEALTAATGNIKDSTLKARAQKHRLALALLAAHRASVKGDKAAAPKHAVSDKHAVEEMRQDLAQRIGKMRSRIVQNSAE